MPNLRDITRRIESVKKTSQITKAMQMVAAAKLRKTQEALENTRPYAEKMEEVVRNLVAQAEEGVHPLIQERPGPRKLELVVVSSDRGLCGGSNTNLFRRTQAFLKEEADQYEAISLNLIGRKGRDFFKRRPVTIGSQRNQLFSGPPQIDAVRPVAREMIRSFVSGETDEVGVLFNKFHSIMTQKPTYFSLLPLEKKEAAEPADPEAAAGATDYLFEPARNELLAELLPRYIEVQLYWILLESMTSEFAARMTAMDSATSNAKEMIDKLTLTFNRARQAAITTELMDIVSGAEALQ